MPKRLMMSLVALMLTAGAFAQQTVQSGDWTIVAGPGGPSFTRRNETRILAGVVHVDFHTGSPCDSSADLNQRVSVVFWLEHKCIAANQSDRDHPERNHVGKVVRRDPDTYTNRVPDCLGINLRGDVGDGLTMNQAGNAGRKFDHLDASLHLRP